MDKGDAAVTVGVGVPHQRRKPVDIIGKDCHPVVEHMVDGHHRHITVDQLHHLRIVEIHAGDHRSIHAPVVAVLQIGHCSAAEVPVDKGDIIAQLFHLHFEAVQHRRKVLVGQAALPLVHKQNAKVVGTVGLHRAGRHIGHIAHTAGRLANTVAGRSRDVRLAIERFAHRCHRDTAFTRQIF